MRDYQTSKSKFLITAAGFFENFEAVNTARESLRIFMLYYLFLDEMISPHAVEGSSTETVELRSRNANRNNGGNRNRYDKTVNGNKVNFELFFLIFVLIDFLIMCCNE